MAANTTASLCRLTVMSTNTRVDLAVPLDLRVADLMATLVRTLGPKVADEGAAAGGFVLQRTGEMPLDPALSLRAAQVGDGDLLHLRMRAAQLPEVAYDDVLDAVATGVLTRSARWTAEHTARACAWGGLGAVAFVLLVCLLSGPSWYVPAGIVGGLAVLLIGGAGVLDRAYRQTGAALVAAGLAIACAFAAGAMVVGGDLPAWAFGADQLLPAASAAVLLGLLGLVVLTRGTPGFTAVIGAGILLAIGSAVAGFTDLDAAATGAFSAGVALLASPLIPVAAFKLSRMQLPIVPADAADLRAEVGTVDSARVLGQAVRADQFLTGLAVSLGVTLAGAAVFLAPDGTVGMLLASVLGGIVLLRARLFTGRSQRLAMLIAALVCGAAVCFNLAIEAGTTVRLLAIVLPVAGFALLMFALVVLLPGRRYAPPSGRAADIVESLLVLAVLPLILGIIGVYSEIRELIG